MFDGIVYVDYAKIIKPERIEFLHSLTKPDHLVIVNNLTSEMKFQNTSYHCSNELFEFGGYQRGFDLLYNRGISSILFVNSTIFDNPMVRYHLDLISDLAEIEVEDDNVVIGDCRKCHYLPQVSFVVSNVFLVKNCRQEIKFVDHVTQKIMMSNTDVRNKYQKLETIYGPTFVEHFKNWMLPSRIWQGWYKLKYFEPPSDELLLRKIFAIYCEHNLLKYNDLSGLNVTQSHKGRFLKLCYRLSLNYCKLKTRVLAGLYLKLK